MSYHTSKKRSDYFAPVTAFMFGYVIALGYAFCVSGLVFMIYCMFNSAILVRSLLKRFLISLRYFSWLNKGWIHNFALFWIIIVLNVQRPGMEVLMLLRCVGKRMHLKNLKITVFLRACLSSKTQMLLVMTGKKIKKFSGCWCFYKTFKVWTDWTQEVDKLTKLLFPIKCG